MRKIRVLITHDRVALEYATDTVADSRHTQQTSGVTQRSENPATKDCGNTSLARAEIQNRPTITPREIEVLKFVVEGLSNRQIAAQMEVSIKTVEKHRQGVMNKLHIHDTAGLARYAVARGIILQKDVSNALARRFHSRRGYGAEAGIQPGQTKRITARETEVLKLIADGWVNKQIASELNISIKTVGNHRQAVMNRLNIHHVAGLTRYAISTGLAATTDWFAASANRVMGPGALSHS